MLLFYARVCFEDKMLKKSLLFFLFLASVWAAEKFDWSQVLAIPPGTNQTAGNQILHFKSLNKPFWDNPEAELFVNTYLSEAIPLASDAEVLKFGSDHVELDGLFVELGVCTGKTINFIAALNPHQKIYGFDSFEGLPEDWVRGDKIIAAGTFAFKNPDTLPPVLHNVDLIKGWFENTLPEFAKRSDPIAFLHIDCDIYSSTATAFQALEPHIVPGTIIVFDELYNYPGCESHEFKAFQEFLDRTGLQAKYLAYNIYHEQVAVQIVESAQGSM